MTSESRGELRDAPIGIFDSGLGGLTVVHAVLDRLPAEDLVYLGDTARVPYGTRSPKTVLSYARSCAARLRDHGVKLLVVACNTVSAVALEMLAVELDIPVLGVIGPGARAGVRASPGGRIGVVATAGTVDSGAYARAIAAEDSRAEAIMEPAPLLVPLAEEGWTEGEVPTLVARRYLTPLVEARVDSLVLGCTHYPLLKGTLERELAALQGHALPVIDSAHATAEELAALLDERDLATARGGPGQLTLLVTDVPKRFADVAARFLGRSLEGLDVRAVDL
jgi:glutamate racemase